MKKLLFIFSLIIVALFLNTDFSLALSLNSFSERELMDEVDLSTIPESLDDYDINKAQFEEPKDLEIEAPSVKDNLDAPVEAEIDIVNPSLKLSPYTESKPVSSEGLHLDPSYLGEDIVESFIKTDITLDTQKNTSNLVLRIANIILTFATSVAIVSLVIGALKLVSSGGNEESMGKAKTIVLWSIAGLLVMIFSFAIVGTVIQAIFAIGG